MQRRGKEACHCTSTDANSNDTKTVETMKISATAALFALAASTPGANAVDFDFRDFEGLWEGTDPVVKSAGDLRIGQTVLATVQCGATGDFRKASCDVIAVIEAAPLCGGRNAVAEKMFILDQFDADTGMTDVLTLDVKCCTPAGCAAMPDTGLGPGEGKLHGQFTMLPGKSNNHVRAITAKIGAGPSSDPFDLLEVDVQLRRTAGGFKSYA